LDSPEVWFSPWWLSGCFWNPETLANKWGDIIENKTYLYL
jgi:hypothetical protein